jgi:hypothetical protein
LLDFEFMYFDKYFYRVIMILNKFLAIELEIDFINIYFFNI